VAPARPAGSDQFRKRPDQGKPKVPRKFVRIDDLAFRDNGCQSIVAVIERKRNYRELNRAAFIARMDSSPPVNEFDFFHATPRRRDKSTVRLRNVSVFLKSSDTAADLFDALFKCIPN
jgi:hypothetical protein